MKYGRLLAAAIAVMILLLLGAMDVSAQPGDKDGDGVDDASDNCPNTANTNQSDVDGDSIGDLCDTETGFTGVGDCGDDLDNDGDGDTDGADTGCGPGPGPTPTPPPPDVTVPSATGLTGNGTPVQITSVSLVIHKDITACVPAAAPVVTLTLSDGTVLTATMTNIPGTLWEATFPAPFPPGTATMQINVDCPPLGAGAEDLIEIGNILFFDPAGTILDACTGLPLSGATVTLLVSPGLIPPPTTDHIPVTNPQTTAGDGAYSWVVVPGSYVVMASLAGFVTNSSPVVTVPPPVTGLDISLTPVTGCVGAVDHDIAFKVKGGGGFVGQTTIMGGQVKNYILKVTNFSPVPELPGAVLVVDPLSGCPAPTIRIPVEYDLTPANDNDDTQFIDIDGDTIVESVAFARAAAFGGGAGAPIAAFDGTTSHNGNATFRVLYQDCGLANIGTPFDYKVTGDVCHSGDAAPSGFFLPLGGPCLVTQPADGGIDPDQSNDAKISRFVNDTKR